MESLAGRISSNGFKNQALQSVKVLGLNGIAQKLYYRRIFPSKMFSREGSRVDFDNASSCKVVLHEV